MPKIRGTPRRSGTSQVAMPSPESAGSIAQAGARALNPVISEMERQDAESRVRSKRLKLWDLQEKITAMSNLLESEYQDVLSPTDEDIEKHSTKFNTQLGDITGGTTNEDVLGEVGFYAEKLRLTAQHSLKKRKNEAELALEGVQALETRQNIEARISFCALDDATCIQSVASDLVEHDALIADSLGQDEALRQQVDGRARMARALVLTNMKNGGAEAMQAAIDDREHPLFGERDKETPDKNFFPLGISASERVGLAKDIDIELNRQSVAVTKAKQERWQNNSITFANRLLDPNDQVTDQEIRDADISPTMKIHLRNTNVEWSKQAEKKSNMAIVNDVRRAIAAGDITEEYQLAELIGSLGNEYTPLQNQIRSMKDRNYAAIEKATTKFLATARELITGQSILNRLGNSTAEAKFFRFTEWFAEARDRKAGGFDNPADALAAIESWVDPKVYDKEGNASPNPDWAGKSIQNWRQMDVVTPGLKRVPRTEGFTGEGVGPLPPTDPKKARLPGEDTQRWLRRLTVEALTQQDDDGL